MPDDLAHYEALIKRKDKEIDRLREENHLLMAVALKRASLNAELMERLKKLQVEHKPDSR